MVRTGYAQVLRALSKASRPPPTRAQGRARLETLVQFIARGVLPNKFPKNSRKKWRGSLDPDAKDEGLSADNPNIFSVEKFVRKAKVSEQLSLQLRIMVLETQIYLLLRKIYEVAVDKKFPSHMKDKFKKWAASTETPENIAMEEDEDVLASSWGQYDRMPELVIIMPELRAFSQPSEPRHLYPSLLRDWWSKGYIKAQLIDSKGKRTRLQVWELTRHIGKSQCDPRYLQAEISALQAERLKAELYMLTLKQDISAAGIHLPMASSACKAESGRVE
ncbi:hypothetical protein N0V93_006359 [Gnomoniopsis smithogilvyi]|uniref:Uncharacterized protein n=1 Tax=Gnomoniopsis smithogilvyi TaxID=1191159 RepID=A0A9W8YN32_9PEZI|nr:hypothetical protein N0V93_006359 [Gnomoniopsis smithogilvyi]